LPNSANKTAVIVPWEKFIIGLRFCEEKQIEEIYILNTKRNCGKPTDIWNARVLQNPKSLEGFFIEYQSGKKGFVKENDPNLHAGDPVLVQVLYTDRDDKPPTFSTNIQLPQQYSVWKLGQKNYRVSQSLSTDVQNTWKKALQKADLPQSLLIRTFAGDYSEEKLDRIKAETTKAESLSEIIRSVALFEKLSVQSDFEHVAFKILTQDTTSIWSNSSWETDASAFITASNEGFFGRYESLSDIPQDLKVQIKRALARLVPLPSGGSVYFEQTKAMHTVDVNSAGYNTKIPYDQVVKNVNREAASCVGKQICLRNLSGLLAIDFVSSNQEDMLDDLAGKITPYLEGAKQKYALSNVEQFGVLMASRRRSGLTLRESLGESADALYKVL